MSIAYTISARASARRVTSLRFAAIAAAVLLAAGCGGDDADGPTSPGGQPTATATVQATPDIRFTPATVELIAGGTVTFAFGPVSHNVFFDDAPAGAPGNITAPTASQSVARTFATAGRYRYNCHIHPGMSGVINVH
jgi:plastocyanin